MRRKNLMMVLISSAGQKPLFAKDLAGFSLDYELIIQTVSEMAGIIGECINERSIQFIKTGDYYIQFYSDSSLGIQFFFFVRKRDSKTLNRVESFIAQFIEVITPFYDENTPIDATRFEFASDLLRTIFKIKN